MANFAVFLSVGFILGLLVIAIGVYNSPEKPRLCPPPYETLLTKEGAVCRMPPEQETIYYVTSADSGITYSCTEKPQKNINVGVYE